MRHYRIKVADALAAHDRALQAGGFPGIRRIEDVLSAIARPYPGYHRSIQRKAAALFQSVATSHGFVDGNKRTAVLLTDLLLTRSGYELRAAPDDISLDHAIEEFAVSVAMHDPGFDQVVAWFEARIHKP